MNSQITTTDPRLKKATPAEITEHMRLLWTSLPVKGSHDESAMVLLMQAYAIALEGYPEWAIANAVRAFIRGTVPGASRSFCPKPPELAEAVRAQVQHIYDEIDREATRRRQEEQRAAQIEDRRPAQTPEEQRRMGFKMSLLSAGMGMQGGADKVAAANAAGLPAMIALGREWGVKIPEGLEA